MEELWPAPFEGLSLFHKALILKLIRPDKAVIAIKVYLILNYEHIIIKI